MLLTVLYLTTAKCASQASIAALAKPNVRDVPPIDIPMKSI